MIAIDKSKVALPSYLSSHWANDAFQKNIEAKKYISGSHSNEDIKKALKIIYNNKCAYCGCDVENIHQVEHYRPSSKYYWLALDWQNLLLVCSECNSNKSDKFPTFEVHLDNFISLENSSVLDSIEVPQIINPEQETDENLEKHFTYNLKTGEIVSETTRGKSTINTCKLNREDLCKRRREMVGDFKNDILKFMNDSNSPSLNLLLFATQQKEFLAFRRYILEHKIDELLDEILKQCGLNSKFI